MNVAVGCELFFSFFFSKSSFPKNVRQLSLTMSCASRKEHVYIANTLSYNKKTAHFTIFES